MNIAYEKPHRCHTCTTELQSECAEKVQSLSVGLNHKLNTPLGIALTALTALENRLHDAPNELSLAELKGAVELALSNLSRSIHYLSEFKQVTQPNVSSSPEAFNLQHLLNQVLELIKHRYPETDVRVKLLCGEELTLHYCEKVCHAIFENIIDNAFVHGFKDSTLPPELVINAIYDNLTDNYYLMFKDNGVGIPELLQDKVLSPFYSTNSDRNKVGLGLNEVEHLVTQMLNGKISIVSEQSSPGTVVKIVFPGSAKLVTGDKAGD